jgi:porin
MIQPSKLTKTLLILATTLTTVHGADLKDWATQTYMTGDWGGERSRLATNGVNFEFFYIASNPNNVAGGIQTASLYQGALLMSMDIDSAKTLGYDGGTFHVSGAWINGQNLFQTSTLVITTMSTW